MTYQWKYKPHSAVNQSDFCGMGLALSLSGSYPYSESGSFSFSSSAMEAESVDCILR